MNENLHIRVLSEQAPIDQRSGWAQLRHTGPDKPPETEWVGQHRTASEYRESEMYARID